MNTNGITSANIGSLYASHNPASSSFSYENHLLQVKEELRNSKSPEEIKKILELGRKWAASSLVCRLAETKGGDAYLTDLVYQVGIKGQENFQTGKTTEKDREFVQLPGLVATCQRFVISQQQTSKLIQERFKSSKKQQEVAYIPCGLMREGLTLPVDSEMVKFTGIDKDPQACERAEKLAIEHQIPNVSCHKADALDLKETERYDIINSNGLNVYLDEWNVDKLYSEFFNALKPGGYLIISQIMVSQEQNREAFDPHSYEEEAMLLGHIVKMCWKPPLTEAATKKQLAKAGFTFVSVHRDKANRFPTFIVQKPLKETF